GSDRVSERLIFDPDQQPVVAQIWGTIPESFYKVAQDIKKRGFAGIDINMGCPERTVIRDGACSGLIRTPELAAEIIQATKEGSGGLPVSVKTRIGFEKESIDEWLSFLLKQDISTLTVHLRTVRELSKVPAHWELMPQVVRLRDSLAPHTFIVGNGDVTSLSEIKEKFEAYHCDGFMVGRGIFANPWMFNSQVDLADKTVEEKISLYLHHIDMFKKQWDGVHHFAQLKKFAKTYINNFPAASDFREKLMETKTIDELQQTLESLR
ncbi:MAG TPA: tRNA-dihydrouridine synthase, partial [Candidatus Saccharimonadales bacterium]|nr:tRNA-dihydrouridine synthase [Candidatus Saccharimonadales bacterium]